MDYEITLNETTATRRRIVLKLVDETDGYTPKTGETGNLSGWVSKNGAAESAVAGGFVEIDATNLPGVYYYSVSAGEVDTVGFVVLHFECSGCRNVDLTVRVGADNRSIQNTINTAIAAGVDVEVKLVKNGENAVDAFVVTDSQGEAVTGLVQGNFDVYLYNPNGQEVSGSTYPVTITELGSGVYRTAFTPDAVGDWVLTVIHLTYLPNGVHGNYAVFNQLFDDISVENLGLGNRLVAITVTDDVTLQPVAGVFIEVFNNAETLKMAFAYTESNGLVTFMLWDGTYKVRLSKIGQYTFAIQPKTMVVDADETVSYTGTAVALPLIPPTAGTCIVYGYELDLSGNPMAVQIKAEIVGDAKFLTTNPHIVRMIETVSSRARDGYWQIILTRSSEFTVSAKYRFTINSKQMGKYTIPDQDSIAFKTLVSGS